MVFFAYTSSLPTFSELFIQHSDFFVISYLIFVLAAVVFTIFLIVKILRTVESFSQQYVLLEIKPGQHAELTNEANTKLLEILHSIEKPQTLLNKILGIKKFFSFEIVATKKNGIQFLIRIPKREAASFRKMLLSYLPGIEVTTQDDYIPNRSFNKIVEYTLKGEFIFPLAAQADIIANDSLSYLTGALTKLDEKDTVAIQYVVSSIHPSTHAHISNVVHKINKKLLKGAPIEDLHSASIITRTIAFLATVLAFVVLSPVTFLAWIFTSSKHPLPIWLFDEGKKATSREGGSTKRSLLDSIHAKISQPLFEVHIRVLIDVNSDSPQRVQTIQAFFESFTTPHQEIVKDKNIFRYVSLPLIKTLHHMIANYRLPYFSTSSVLSTTELSSLFHLPNGNTVRTEDLQKTKSPKLPTPITLKQNADQFDITFAQNDYGESTTPIGLTLEERRRHCYIIGATGTGKTTLLTHMIHQDMVKGNGLAVIDPHGDLAEKILGVIPESRKDDVVYFNPYDIEYPIGLNVLDIPKGLSEVELQREKDFITSTLISIFHKLYDARYSGPRMEHILRNVILTALEQEKPTLFTIYDLLTNVKYRKKVTANLKDDILKSFWKNEFEKLGSFQKAEQISPITNKLGRFLTTSMTRNIFNQSDSKLDFEDIMNNKKILICNLSKGKIGEDTAYFLGGLFTAKIQLTALRRVHIPEAKRPDFFLYIDEFQNFATMSFAQILSEARKYRLSVILAHQNTVQIEKDLLETIIGNTGTIICFRTTSPLDETKLLPVFSPEVQKGQIPNLPSFNFYMKINALQPQSPFSGSIDDFLVCDEETIRNAVILNSQKKYGMPRSQEVVKVTTPAIHKILKTESSGSKSNIFFEQVKN